MAPRIPWPVTPCVIGPDSPGRSASMSSAAAGKNRKGDSAVVSTSTGARASEVRELAGLHRRWSEEARAALSERSRVSGFGRRRNALDAAQIATNGARTSAEPMGGMIEAAE